MGEKIPILIIKYLFFARSPRVVRWVPAEAVVDEEVAARCSGAEL